MKTWTETRQLVWQRDAAHCVACGQRLDVDTWECHHRRLRAQGGGNALSNLLALCPGCHVEAHSRRLEWSEPRGYVLRSGSDPWSTPVLRHDPWSGDWQLAQPTDDGHWEREAE